MPIEVEGPGGVIVEFPDGTTTGTIRGAMQKRFGAPRSTSVAGTAEDVATQIPMGFNRGFDTLLNLPGDLLMRAPARALGLEDYVPERGSYATRFNPGGSLYFGSRESDAPQTTAGRYAGQVGEALGASSVPVAGMVAAAPRLANMTATTVSRAIGQQVGRSVAANPAAAVGLDVVSATGSGLAQEGAKDAGFGPAGQAVAGIAGGMVPIAAAGVLGNARRRLEGALARNDPYARVAAGLGDMSVDDLASAAAVGTTGQSARVSRRAFDVLGEEMVRTGGDSRASIQAAINRLVADGVAPSTAQEQIRRIRNVQHDSDLMLGEFPAVAGSNMATRARRPHNVMDEDAGATTHPGTQGLFGYVANTGTMASSQNVRNAISERADTLADHTRALVQSLAPDGRTIQDVEGAIAGLQRRARTEYDAVYNAPGGTAVNYRMLHGLLGRIAERHMGRMYGRSGDQADALRQALDRFYVTRPAGVQSRADLPGLQDQVAQARLAVREARRQRRPRDEVNDLSRYVDDLAEQLRITSRDASPPTQQVLMPTLQMMQDARSGIRGQIQAARQSGRNDIAAILQPLYRDITRSMERASPRWRTANRRWADLSLQEVAADLGEAFARQAGPRSREQLRQFQQLAPEAQDVVRIHFVQQMLDRIENAARLGGQQNLGRLFSRDHDRRMIRAVLGDEAAMLVARLVRDANVMSRSRDMLKGSPTHIRGQIQAEQDADINTIASAANLDWRNWRQAAFEHIVAAWRERRNRTIGRAITTPMSDVPAVAGEITRMRRASERARAASQPPQNRLLLRPGGVVAPAINPLMEQRDRSAGNPRAL